MSQAGNFLKQTTDGEMKKELIGPKTKKAALVIIGAQLIRNESSFCCAFSSRVIMYE